MTAVWDASVYLIPEMNRDIYRCATNHASPTRSTTTLQYGKEVVVV